MNQQQQKSFEHFKDNTFTTLQMLEFIKFAREQKEGEQCPYTEEEITQVRQELTKQANKVYRAYWKKLGWKY